MDMPDIDRTQRMIIAVILIPSLTNHSKGMIDILRIMIEIWMA
jgi:hypothetical protein